MTHVINFPNIVEKIFNKIVLSQFKTDQKFSVSMEDIEKLVRIQYARGVLVAKNSSK